ncbi:hypothetical protein PVAND_003564 [Polypedilum vanderplanki]|uniref:Centromere/kinetochore protein zw10-like protein n=1 Tax=Polypedilum vanderplanki TaxID=319348 RepID=A0A9J6BUX7_POLVA|nr:hypothetical protein PVAND_003564 [Polypedilum vanderplanki]
MSLIKKIVEIVDKTDSVDAKKNINKLNKEIKDYKEKVRLFIESNYVDFLPVIDSNEFLLEEGNNLESEVSIVTKNYNENRSITRANEELTKLMENLEDSHLGLQVSLRLVKIDSLMQKIQLCNETKNYKEARNILNSIQNLIGDPDDKIIRRLDMYKSLSVQLSLQRENMLKNLDSHFNSLVQVNQKSFPKTRLITVTISKNTQTVADCINSLLECDYSFDSLFVFLMKNIFEPIVCRAVSMDFKENDKETTMVLSYSSESVSDELRPGYEIVFVNLRGVLFYLRNMNVVISNGTHFLAHIFHNEAKQIFDLLFNECLIYNIPKTFEEKTHSTISNDIVKLGNHLLELHFFESADELNALVVYYEKIDELFFQQYIKHVQECANKILKRDLHEMILITDDATLSTSTPLTFPKSMISKSTLELIKLLEKLTRQASSCSQEDESKKKNLLASVKCVLENYSFTIQLHHSQLLSKIPQQSALFYNNCMYLCNWISLSDELEHMDVVIHELKRNGEEFFECQVAKHKIQLFEILKEFDPFQSVNEFKPEHFKPIRQCIRQMDLLKNVWQTILPSDVYNKTIGDLLDVIVLDLIKKITSLEDISTSLASGLVELIKGLEEKGQLLFEADTSALDVVTNWQKLLHLQFILDASLLDIQSSWKNNIISKSFKADEVKRLIRALFQNTERRANCLQNIT